MDQSQIQLQSCSAMGEAPFLASFPKQRKKNKEGRFGTEMFHDL